MRNRSVYIIAFVLIVVAQLWVPAQMISEHEDVAANGKVLKFKTAPIDPYDAFRGKYIILNFREDKGKITQGTKKLNYGDAIFVTFKDSSGYALVESVLADEPKGNPVYVKAKVDYIDNNFIFFNSKKEKNTAQSIHIDYPFERYYMNEAKAPKAETAYNRTNRDAKNNVYAEIAIKNGVGVVKDVIIENVSIKDYVGK
jgi:uncharacterized membrane-anchored protein